MIVLLAAMHVTPSNMHATCQHRKEPGLMLDFQFRVNVIRLYNFPDRPQGPRDCQYLCSRSPTVLRQQQQRHGSHDEGAIRTRRTHVTIQEYLRCL